MSSIIYNGREIVPSKIICVGRNYVEHIHELANEVPDELVLFMKPNSAIATEVRLPREECRYEAEICLLVEGGVLVGAAFGLDLTLPVIQNRLKAKGLPWEKAKAFDNSAIFTDFVPINDWCGLSLELWINGELRQRGGVELMIYQPEDIIKEICRWFTLNDGDIVMTGTPKGVGDLLEGDRLLGKLLLNDQLLVSREWVVLREGNH